MYTGKPTMAASDKQRAASRRNAALSTGPKTPQGKAKSRMNAYKHGLTAKSLVVMDESADELDDLAQAVCEELQPGSTMEREIAQRIATIMWRIRRIPEIEAGLYSISDAEETFDLATTEDAGVPSGSWSILQVNVSEFRTNTHGGDDEPRRQAASALDLPQVRLAAAFRRDSKSGDGLARLSRYEVTLTRQLERSLVLFHRLKAERLKSVQHAKEIAGQAGLDQS